ncbi:hypothetical protein [Massilia psychrophila]|nr:hypothetical protein [Massilia psychrophila]
MNVNQENYKKLLKIVPMLKEMTSATTLLASSGATALMSLCQYGEHPVGHTVAEPSMIIAVYQAGAATLVAKRHALQILFDAVAAERRMIRALPPALQCPGGATRVTGQIAELAPVLDIVEVHLEFVGYLLPHLARASCAPRY